MRRFIARSHLALVLSALLLVPLAGVANGARLDPSTTKCTTPDRALSAPNLFGRTRVCLVDQYGNSYNFTIDAAHTYIYGTATEVQGCSETTWPLVGSYVQKNGIQLELTAANPAANDTCVGVYKLKGTYPNAAWYYDFGYGDQEFTYGTCARPGKPLRVEHGGALR